MIDVLPGLSIPEDELSFTFARGGGPGGQHVNKVATRATLHFYVDGCAALGDAQRAMIRERLATRIDARGVLRVVASRERSQFANRRAALERFVELLREALDEDPERHATRPTRASQRRRVDTKTRRGAVKRARGRIDPGED